MQYFPQVDMIPCPDCGATIESGSKDVKTQRSTMPMPGVYMRENPLVSLEILASYSNSKLDLGK